jgi:purine-cytosine permease-like protein
MIVSRYSVGYYGGIIFSVLNILTQVAPLLFVCRLFSDTS